MTMDYQNLSREELIEKLQGLQHQVEELKVTKVALDAQREMLENLLGMAATPELEHVLKVTLQQALDLSSKLTKAECGSLVLLDPNLVVRDNLLNPCELTPLQQQSITGNVLHSSYASWVNSHRQVVAIADTWEDEYWMLPGQNAATRSVLSVPILKNKALLGVLTLMHSQPGYFNATAVNLMEGVAKQIALAIEYARFYGQLETYCHALKLEIEKGREMQRDFLPNPLLDLPGWEIAASFKPARQVAGDFYDVFHLSGGCVGLVIGDVCDKGVGAALFMGLFRSLLRLFSGQHAFHQSNLLNGSISELDQALISIDALKAVTLTNNYIADTHGQLCMFATIFFGVLNPATGVLTYINGGHESPIVLRASGGKERLKPTGPAVGTFLNPNFKVQEVQLQPGDILLSYSDGIPDARNPEGTRFTEQQLLSMLDAPTATALIDGIQEKLQSYVAEADPFDDITLLALRKSALPT